MDSMTIILKANMETTRDYYSYIYIYIYNRNVVATIIHD